MYSFTGNSRKLRKYFNYQESVFDEHSFVSVQFFTPNIFQCFVCQLIQCNCHFYPKIFFFVEEKEFYETRQFNMYLKKILVNLFTFH